jgi:hypothetical protein
VAYGFPRGDFDLNGNITIADVAAGMRALTDLSKYQSDNELSPPQLSGIGDVDQDTSVNNKDIQSLLVALANQAPMSPAGASSPAIESMAVTPGISSSSPGLIGSALSTQSVVNDDTVPDTVVSQPLAAAKAISILTASTTTVSQATAEHRSLFIVSSGSSADANPSLDTVHAATASNAHPQGSAITAIDDFYGQLQGRTTSSLHGHDGHATASDSDLVSDNYYEELSLQLLPR